MIIAGTSTMADFGCFITCLAMLSYEAPDVVLKKLQTQGGLNGDLIDSPKAAKTLGLKYEGKVTTRPTFPCIAEVDFIPETSKKEQHFVIFLPLGEEDKIIDPWTGKVRKGDHYGKIVSWRLFHENKPSNPLDLRIKVLEDDLLEYVKVTLEKFRKEVTP